MSEFIQTKSQVHRDQNEAISDEKRRCNALLDVKQNEIDNLKVCLQTMSKRTEDLSIRTELLALLSGKNRMLTRVKVLQMKAFMGLRKYLEWKKYKKVLARKTQNEHRLKVQKLCF